MIEPPQFTNVHLITGFLGSGKTTLLKRRLVSPALADTAVLINEFGEIGLDHELLERVEADTALLSSECLCRTVRGDLAQAIKPLHVKGIPAVEGEEAPVVVQAVQQLVHAPLHLPHWPSPDRRSRLVFNVKGIDGATLRRSFEAFIG